MRGRLLLARRTRRRDGTRQDLLVADDHSRTCSAARPSGGSRGTTSWPFTLAGEEHGWPAATLTDNGAVYTSRSRVGATASSTCSPTSASAAQRGRAVEATTGFEPVIEVLQTSALATWLRRPVQSSSLATLAAPRGFEPRFTDPKSAVLPLDEGASGRHDSLRGRGGREWSGRRDSNPRPSPWQGDALPTEPLPPDPDEQPTGAMMWCREPDSNWRHRDFQSRALPTELSRPAGAVEILDHIRRTRAQPSPRDDMGRSTRTSLSPCRCDLPAGRPLRDC